MINPRRRRGVPDREPASSPAPIITTTTTAVLVLSCKKKNQKEGETGCSMTKGNEQYILESSDPAVRDLQS